MCLCVYPLDWQQRQLKNEQTSQATSTNIFAFSCLTFKGVLAKNFRIWVHSVMQNSSIQRPSEEVWSSVYIEVNFRVVHPLTSTLAWRQVSIGVTTRTSMANCDDVGNQNIQYVKIQKRTTQNFRASTPWTRAVTCRSPSMHLVTSRTRLHV